MRWDLNVCFGSLCAYACHRSVEGPAVRVSLTPGATAAPAWAEASADPRRLKHRHPTCSDTPQITQEGCPVPTDRPTQTGHQCPRSRVGRAGNQGAGDMGSCLGSVLKNLHWNQ